MRTTSVLPPPLKSETRLGWWFMWTFRKREVVLRAARNRVLAEAYLAACNHSLPELTEALDAYTKTQEEAGR